MLRYLPLLYTNTTFLKNFDQNEIARRAGVSQATVSRCLRNEPGQNPATRERIQRIAEELGYVPNSFAAGLASARSGRGAARANLAIIGGNMAHDPVNTWGDWAAFVKAAEQRARKLGYSLEYFWRYDSETTDVRLRRILEARGIQGVILLMISPGELDLPWDSLAVVSAGMPAHKRPKTHFLSWDAFRDTRMALRECLKLGYTRPAVVVSLDYDFGHEDGSVTAAFLLHSLKLPPSQKIPPVTARPEGYNVRQFSRWLNKYHPDVILAVGPRECEFLLRCGKRIPKDVGYVSLTGAALPDCTHVDQRYDLAGAAAVNLVTAQLHHNERGWPENPQCVILPSEWREGLTTRRPVAAD